MYNSSDEIEAFKLTLPPFLRKQWEEVEAGIRLPDLSSDSTFKYIFNPDVHKDRLNRFLKAIFPDIPAVLGSANTEMLKSSVYSKKTIMDLIARLANDGVCDLEMQKTAQEFISTRMEVYASDILVLQYAVNKNEKMGELTYDKIPDSYLVVIMKESPSLFANSSHIIHKKRIVTDTGIELNSPLKVVYMEALKCYNYFREKGSYPENCEAIGPWLCAIADINYTKKKEADNPEIQSICSDLYSFGKSKEALMGYLSEKYAQIDRNSELAQAHDQGVKEGMLIGVRALISIYKEINITKEAVAEKIEKDFLVTHEQALEYIERFW